ncbi:chromate efflux transporter [Maritimibacter sp. UBA3975]|uniref:chromate efflux transporter n=1 Tax=Maritimibacter sp. UBA3975 TaxID=1946833 RepID=UPI000C090D17|nr:chromate efflux transporter [Maritimibacter sp. UBA3975]MAM62388.1 chromate transporter [Maritimibacter sp.]|tara:strand:+ start:8673 stop:9881 length:1209 start_codon:yes stop_codon:yes gene_type:complete
MQPPALAPLTRAFTRIGLLSFGGPVAQIAVMHEELVERRGWIDEALFSRGLAFCMVLPGPEAMQMCTYAGWRLRGVPGGLIAGALFVLPGAVFMAVVTLAYLSWGQTPFVEDAFLGIKAAVIVVVARALARMARKTLAGVQAWGLAVLAFAALLFAVPFPAVVLAAGLFGYLTANGRGGLEPIGWRSTLGTAALWTALWLMPLAILYATGTQPLADITAFFSRLAAVSFGGAYAALAWMAQALVETQGWLTPEQMVDGLGLAETTPGPLVLVTQFAGMVAASPGGTGAALIAGGFTLWAIFIPCFGLVFTLAPHLEAITAHPRLAAALKAVSAAIVGVIASLALYFARNFFFSDGSLSPDSLSLPALALSAIAALCLLAARLSLPLTLALLAIAGALAGTLW